MPQSMHPLGGAFARIDRADVHIRDFHTLSERYRQAKEDEFLVKYQLGLLKPAEGNSIQIIRGSVTPMNDLPLEISVVVGDIIHNLRVALDYLVFELAIHDSGRPQDGTQFIIEEVKSDTKDKTRGFDPKSKRLLRGLSQAHIDAIELLQPYNGVRWTQTLKGISNLDKHRKLMATVSQSNSSITYRTGATGSFEGRPGKVFSGIGKDGADIHAEGQYAIEIQFPDGTPVIKTLDILKREVRAVIDSFGSS